ncbi:hypothetical protein PUNSTDRAFT_145957, partial [Punctularia strigosozonata HHB-11173 SS5]|uniref:uncharacterized protein n=1 Tax=Punctularia strigosozonata (strain HHB-11173) TaxID=741275 RepID=UPI0004418591
RHSLVLPSPPLGPRHKRSPPPRLPLLSSRPTSGHTRPPASPPPLQSTGPLRTRDYDHDGQQPRQAHGPALRQVLPLFASPGDEHGRRSAPPQHDHDGPANGCQRGKATKSSPEQRLSRAQLHQQRCLPRRCTSASTESEKVFGLTHRGRPLGDSSRPPSIAFSLLPGLSGTPRASRHRTIATTLRGTSPAPLRYIIFIILALRIPTVAAFWVTLTFFVLRTLTTTRYRTPHTRRPVFSLSLSHLILSPASHRANLYRLSSPSPSSQII